MLKADGAYLSAVEKRFRSLPRDIKSDLRKYQRKEVGPIFKEEISSRSDATYLTRKVFKSGNTVKTGAFILLRSAGSSKKLKSGGVTSDLLKQAEFGSKRQNEKKTYTRRSPKGKAHSVTRRVSRQSPAYRKGGYVFYPSAGQTAKRITSLSVQTVMKRLYDSIEGG